MPPRSDPCAALSSSSPASRGSKEDFRLLLAPLAGAGWHAVAVDQRGQYESQGPDEESAYTTEVLAADLLQVVKALGEGPVHLIGHSFGGIVGRAAVLADPSAFLSFVLMDSGPAGLTGGRADVMPFMRAILLDGGMPALLEAQKGLPANPAKPVPSPEAAAFVVERMTGHTIASLLGMGSALLEEPDRVAELAALDLPLLVLYGERDDAWSPETQDDMASRLGCAAIVVINAWHSPAVENPEVTTQVLLDFFG